MTSIFFGGQFSLGQILQKSNEEFAGKTEMSGYSFKKFEGFEKKWKLVTVRFRRDTNEMRFTYANPKAWKALQNGVTNYPEGSVFAKIGVKTDDDPAFTSSAVPSGVRRYQLMVKNSKLHKETQGWGYALFDVNGKTFPEDPKTQARACAACHQAVPQRGYVFSQIMSLAYEKNSQDNNRDNGRDNAKGNARDNGKDSGNTAENSYNFKFETWPVIRLPRDIRLRLPEGAMQIRVLSGELRQNIFQGTLDEIRPILAEESVKTSLPALLLSSDEKRYSVVYLADDKTDDKTVCNKNELAMKAEHSLIAAKDSRYELAFCHPLKNI